MNPFTGRVARATLVTLILLVAAPASEAQTRVRVGTCARTLTAGVGSQFAVASKMGWFAQEGLDVEVVPLTGSTDCVKFVATREFLMTLPSMEPLAIGRLQGVKIKNFYTAYQTPGYAMAVPADSPIQKLSKGTIFTISNPEAAVRILYEVFPFTRPTGKDEATAVREDVHVLRARIPQLKLEPAGVRRWGETNEANLREYMEFLLKWGVLKQRVEAADLMTNELIGEINRFDPEAIAKAARDYKAR